MTDLSANQPAFAVMAGPDCAFAIRLITANKKANERFLSEYAGQKIQTVPLWQAREWIRNWGRQEGMKVGSGKAPGDRESRAPIIGP